MSYKHINVILDLDNTLISAEESKSFDFEKFKQKSIEFVFHNMDNYFIVFERPNVQEFLDFIFKEFTVSVWTAASKDYAIFIIKNVIMDKHPERNVNYIFYSYHCDLSVDQTNKTKNLNILWDIYNIPNFNSKNTIIIDDYNEVYSTNPKNCKQIKEFNYFDDNSEKDVQLLEIIPLLKSLASTDSIGNVKICDYKDTNLLPPDKCNIQTQLFNKMAKDVDNESTVSTSSTLSDNGNSLTLKSTGTLSTVTSDINSILSTEIDTKYKPRKLKAVVKEKVKDSKDIDSNSDDSDSDNYSMASSKSNSSYSSVSTNSTYNSDNS